MMRSIAARYISKHIFAKVFVVMMVFATLEFVLGVVIDLPKIGRGHYTLLDSMCALLLTLPMQLYGLFSVIAFLGVILALGAMAKRNELLVFRAAGLSLRALLQIVLCAVVLMVLLVTAVGESIAPILSARSVHLKESATNAQQIRTHDYWWESNSHFNDVQLISKTKTGERMISLSLPLSGEAASIAYIPVLKKKGQYWVGRNGVLTNLSKQSATVLNHHHLPLRPHFNFSAGQIDRHVASQESWSHLGEMIKQRKQEGRTALRFETAYWNRMLQPIATLVLVLFAIPLVFGVHRSASNGSRLILGVGIGFLFYVTHRLFPPLGILLYSPPLMTVLFPIVLFLLVGIWLCKKVNMP